MILDFEKISATQLMLLPRDQTVFFFSVGVLEDHGPHLPLGLDILEAEKLSFLISKKLEGESPQWNCILMPRVPFAVDGNNSKISLSVRPHVLRDYLVDHCNALAKLGFKYFVCFTGTLSPKQLTAIEDAGKIVRRKNSNFIKSILKLRGESSPALISATSALTHINDLKNGAFYPNPKEHGGKRDTSVALFISSAHVGPQYSKLLPITSTASGFSRVLKRWKKTNEGYWGAPAQADVKTGEKEIFQNIDLIYPKLKAFLEGANPNHLFRSWYSILPPNKSFFKAWVITLLFLLLMIAYSLLSTPEI